MQTLVHAMPHGVLFIYDPTMIVDVPSDTASGPVLATANCVTVWTLGEDDGAVALQLGDESDRPEGTLIFQGMLATEGNKLALNDSGCNVLLSMDVPQSSTPVRVFANHDRYPTKVVCIVTT